METSKSNFLIGLAIGSAIGALAQRFSRTAKAKMLKKKIHNAMAKIADRAESRERQSTGCKYQNRRQGCRCDL